MRIFRSMFVCTLLIAMMAALTVFPSASTAESYGDIAGHWAESEIDSLFQRRIYSGLILEDPEYFRPDQPITRAEFVLILFNAMGLDLKARDQTLTTPYADFDDITDTYRPYLIEGYNRGVMLGRTGGDGVLYSGWDSPLSRQEAITVIGRILNAQSVSELPFTDGDEVADWARDYLAALCDKSIIGGMPDGSFAPFKEMTRAEASHIVHLLAQGRLFVAAEMRIYAGNTDLGFEDGARHDASFGVPFGLSVLGDGTLIVADKEANLLRKITPDTVSTIAGQTAETDINGLPSGGYADAGTALSIKMREPRYICAGSDGTIYYTDGGNNVIRVIASDGKSYTLSGNGKKGYVNDTREKSEYNLPSGIAVSPDGTIFVADSLNNCIRTVTSKGQSAHYAGASGGGYKDGTLEDALFCQPTDLAFGPDGALYVADTGNSMIRVIKDGQVTTLAGSVTERDELSEAMTGGYRDGEADNALFCGPLGICVTGSGVVYVADTDNNLIRKIESGFVTTVAGNLKAGNSTGPALVSMLNAPVDVAVYGGGVYITDSNNHCVKVFGIDLEDE